MSQRREASPMKSPGRWTEGDQGSVPAVYLIPSHSLSFEKRLAMVWVRCLPQSWAFKFWSPVDGILWEVEEVGGNSPWKWILWALKTWAISRSLSYLHACTPRNEPSALPTTMSAVFFHTCPPQQTLIPLELGAKSTVLKVALVTVFLGHIKQTNTELVAL